MSRVRISSPAPNEIQVVFKRFTWIGYPFSAHVAQSVERFLGKEEVHRFDSGRGLHGTICHFGACLLGAAFNGFEYTVLAYNLTILNTMGG